MQRLQFEYFRGMEAEQYSFYRVPKMLFTAECFRSISCEAKVLYGLMLDRMGLSIKNRWLDDNDRIYIIFTVEEIAELMNCGTQKAVKLIKELDTDSGIGLIEKKRLGLGRPNVIYVKNFMIRQDTEVVPEAGEESMDSQNCENHNSGISGTTIQEFPESQFKNCENHNSAVVKTTIQECFDPQFRNGENQSSGIVKHGIQEFPKSQSNNTESIKTEYSETDPLLSSQPQPGKVEKEDELEKMERYRAMVRDAISYAECYADGPTSEREQVDELVELIVEVLLLPDDATVRVAGTDRPVPVVKSRLMKLSQMHIEYVLFCLRRNRAKVGRIKQYILTVLYNAPVTMNSFFQAEVNHDLYGGR